MLQIGKCKKCNKLVEIECWFHGNGLKIDECEDCKNRKEHDVSSINKK